MLADPANISHSKLTLVRVYIGTGLDSLGIHYPTPEHPLFAETMATSLQSSIATNNQRLLAHATSRLSSTSRKITLKTMPMMSTSRRRISSSTRRPKVSPNTVFYFLGLVLLSLFYWHSHLIHQASTRQMSVSKIKFERSSIFRPSNEKSGRKHGKLFEGKQSVSRDSPVNGSAKYVMETTLKLRYQTNQSQNQSQPSEKTGNMRSWKIKYTKISNSSGFKGSSTLKSTSAWHTNSTRLAALTIPFAKSLSACMLIKDDNDILDEWIAYHYYSLDLRYLVVAIDPTSVTSPKKILGKWIRNTDLQIFTWKDEDFMPEWFVQKGHAVPAEYVLSDANRSKWHEGHEDPEQVRADIMKIQSHRFRQVVFLGSCLRHMRATKRRLTFHIDTDEYIVVNPLLRNLSSGENFSIKDMSLSIPDMTEQSSVARVLRQVRSHAFLGAASNFPCLSMPRLLFGSIEASSSTKSHDILLNLTSFETQRWLYHAAYNDTVRNGQPKVLVDVARVPLKDEMFKRKPFSIHRPSKTRCRALSQIDISHPERFPFVVNHYVGNWDRYYARNDTRRSARVYNAKAHVKSGRDEWIMPWLEGFVKAVGKPNAARLLGRKIEI